ncbi:MAG: metalloregulator ArsR/SmtB family transcription factor, partial [Desulfobacteraceae bacterium]|nr:metalloregulator ArsR/SmtB family transcription factor [Desulfobacteraceae bacterium]
MIIIRFSQSIGIIPEKILGAGIADVGISRALSSGSAAGENKIRILVVEDHTLVRQGIFVLLSFRSDPLWPGAQPCDTRLFGAAQLFWGLTGKCGYAIVKSRLTMKRIISMDLEQTAKIFKALAHPTRIKIVQHLIAIDTCICTEIVGIFPYSQSTISQHLKILKESGIV